MLASSIVYVLLNYSPKEKVPKISGIHETSTTIFRTLSITFGSLVFLQTLFEQVD